MCILYSQRVFPSLLARWGVDGGLGNDDAIRSGDLLTRVIADAVLEGRLMRSKTHPEAAKPTPRERTAEEAAEHRNQQDRARVEATAKAAATDARLLSANEEAIESEAQAGLVTVEPEIQGSDTSGVAAEGEIVPDQPARVTPADAPAAEGASETESN